MKKLIILLTTLIIIIAGLSVWNYLGSFHDVNFVIKQSDLTADIYNQDGSKKIASLTVGEKIISLRNGEYYHAPNNDKFGSTKHYFTIDNSTKTIDIDYNYSSTYLKTLLSQEKDNILAIIKSTYPTIIGDYNIMSEQLFNKGEWFGAVIERKISPRDITDPYRIIMHKEGNKWSMIHYPEIVATKGNFPGVPVEVLNSVNDLESNYNFRYLNN